MLTTHCSNRTLRHCHCQCQNYTSKQLSKYSSCSPQHCYLSLFLVLLATTTTPAPPVRALPRTPRPTIPLVFFAIPMNEEIDEFSVYHQDFTTASEWEVFVARIEELLKDWRLDRACAIPVRASAHKWVDKTEEIQFYGSTFTLSYHFLETVEPPEGEKAQNETDIKSLSTQLLSGVWEASKTFISNDDHGPFPVSSWFGLKQYVMLRPHSALTNESQIKLILSSLNIAFANVECIVPMFVKLREHWQQCFRGVFEDNDYRTNFDTIHLKRIPSQCYHLTGLLNLFKGKIASPTPLEPVQMSAKFSYNLKDLETFKWRRPHSDELFLDDDDFKKWINIPFGSIQNPLRSVLLNVIWPKFFEDAVIDSASYSDFDPLMAPVWTITVELEDQLTCLLTEMIRKMLDLLNNEQLLMDALGLSRSLGLLNPLHKITEPPNTISKLVKAAIGLSPPLSEFKGPLPDEQLMPLMYYIFPDAVDSSSYNYPETLEAEFKQTESGEARLCGYIKTGPEDGLVWRLSVVGARLLDAGGLSLLAHFWYEFTQELQYRWEHHIDVPGIAPGMPCARTCLLHQKLQLLNCCIVRARASGQAEPTSSDEEFYDCSDAEGDGDTLLKPVGRLGMLGEATLRSGAPLYVPKTQDPAPKTEDQLEEDAELMLRLGDDARASELRARMMSASLLSDMEAFKAANPGSELCDFVRWYSPRDWLPDNGGALGDRMLLPGNPWTEAWVAARPVPAARQRRLFNESREAERVMHFLRSRSVGGVMDLLLPGVLRAGAARLQRRGARGTTSGESRGRRAWETAARDVAEAERVASRELRVAEVMGEATPGAPLDAADRARITGVAGGVLPTPSCREFVLRVRDHTAPQILRAQLANDLLVVSAFTEHIVL